MGSPSRTAVLLVDDHPFVLDGLEGLLSGQPDFEVTGRAGTVAEATEALRELRPGLVLVDLRLPDGDGTQVLEAASRQRWGTYAAVLSAFRTDEDWLSAARHGARAFLLKTEGGIRVLSALRRVMQGINVLEEEFPPALRERLHQKTVSARELEILRLIGMGLPNKEIARVAGVSENTVKIHLRRLYAKLGVVSRAEAAVLAVQRGLVR